MTLQSPCRGALNELHRENQTPRTHQHDYDLQPQISFNSSIVMISCYKFSFVLTYRAEVMVNFDWCCLTYLIPFARAKEWKRFLRLTPALSACWVLYSS